MRRRRVLGLQLVKGETEGLGGLTVGKRLSERLGKTEDTEVSSVVKDKVAVIAEEVLVLANGYLLVKRNDPTEVAAECDPDLDSLGGFSPVERAETEGHPLLGRGRFVND